MFKSLLPDQVKRKVTIEDIRLGSNLFTSKTKRFTKMSFSYTILGFFQSHRRVSSDIEGSIQKIPSPYKSGKPINFTGTDKIHLKNDCINGSIVNGIREPILYCFDLDNKKYTKNQELNSLRM